MRASLLACVLLGGCIGLPGAPNVPEGGAGASSFDGCARLLVEPVPPELHAYRRMEIRLAFENCGADAVELLDEDACDHGMINVTLQRGSDVFVLRGESAARGGAAKQFCGDLVGLSQRVPPGERVDAVAIWNGTFVERVEPCAIPCDARMGARPAEPGAYRIVARAVTTRGDVTGEANVTLAPPAVPSADPEADVRFAMNASYRQGETAQVWIENVGDRAYRYRTSYAACDLEYYTDEGRPFQVPPGTHCDLLNPAAVEPGERARLFNWSLDECVLDSWGCVEAAPLPPGTYHLRGKFYPALEDWWRRPDDFTYAGWTIRVLPPQ